MRELIFDDGPIQAEFDQGNDAQVLALLNTPSVQVRFSGTGVQAGFVSNASMGVDLGQTALATFLVALRTVLKQTETSANAAQIALVESFLTTFNTERGVDFANADIRAQLTMILGGAEAAAPYLALGYSLKSPAQHVYQRDATAQDVAEVRKQVNREGILSDYTQLWNQYVSTALTNGDRASVKAGLATVATEL